MAVEEAEDDEVREVFADSEIAENNRSHEEEEEKQAQSSSWPVIRFDVSPHRTHHFFRQFRTSSNPNNFLKAVKWSPDGSCFLTSSEDNTLRIFTLPESENDNLNACSVAADEDSYQAYLVVNEGESVYDFCWYPYMSASDPVTNVFATTTRDHPIHLWDASSGEVVQGISE